MNSRERALAALQGLPTDRRPFTAALGLYGARLTECPLRRYYTDAEEFARGQRAVRDVFEPDILFSPFVLIALAEAFGGEARYFNDCPPNLGRPAIDSIDALDGLDVPDVDEHPRILYLRQAIRLLAHEHGKEALVAGILLSPTDLPLMIMGIDAWMETVLFERERALRMTEITTAFFIRLANALLADGADALVLPSPSLSSSFLSRDLIEEFTMPVLRRAFAEVQGPLVAHHGGGRFLESLDLLAGLPGVAAVAVDHRDNLIEARKRLGPGPALMGGPEGPNMGRRSARQVETHCKAILRDRSGDPKFVLCPSGADIAYDTPRENIEALAQAVRSFQETD